MPASPLLDLRDLIATTWAALTPPDYSNARYVHVDKPSEDGASAHRQFMFKPPASGGRITQQGRTRHMITWVFDAVIFLHTPERSRLLFNAPYLEYQALGGALYTLTPYPAGVTSCELIAVRTQVPETDDDGDLDLFLTIEARTQEANA